VGWNRDGEGGRDAEDEPDGLHGAIVFRIGFRRKAALLKVFAKALTD
jgi:hypothetical protein